MAKREQKRVDQISARKEAKNKPKVQQDDEDQQNSDDMYTSGESGLCLNKAIFISLPNNNENIIYRIIFFQFLFDSRKN